MQLRGNWGMAQVQYCPVCHSNVFISLLQESQDNFVFGYRILRYGFPSPLSFNYTCGSSGACLLGEAYRFTVGLPRGTGLTVYTTIVYLRTQFSSKGSKRWELILLHLEGFYSKIYSREISSMYFSRSNKWYPVTSKLLFLYVLPFTFFISVTETCIVTLVSHSLLTESSTNLSYIYWYPL